MKKLKLVLLLVMVFVAILPLASCNSPDDPVPESYTGYYQSSQYGGIWVKAKYCYSDQLLLPECIIGGTYRNNVIVKWGNTTFNYNTEGTFSFQSYVESLSDSSVKGKASFSGKITNSLGFNYFGNKRLWLLRLKNNER